MFLKKLSLSQNKFSLDLKGLEVIINQLTIFVNLSIWFYTQNLLLFPLKDTCYC